MRDWSGAQRAERDWLRGWEQPGERGSRIGAGCDPWSDAEAGDALWERGGWGGNGPWSRMWPPQGNTTRGDALHVPPPRGMTPSLEPSGATGTGTGTETATGLSCPISADPQPIKSGRRQKSPWQLPSPWDTPDPPISEPPCLAAAAPARINQPQRVRACRSPPDSEPRLCVITREPSRRISCEKLLAMGCRGEGGM